jgi:SAM-dependent methyltransferase
VGAKNGKVKNHSQSITPCLFSNDSPIRSDEPSPSYELLPSVWFGEDSELLERMLDFYPHQTPKKILDATVNKRRFWVGSSRPVTGLDIDPAHNPDVVGDNTAMPFKSATFDVVVYDPPHIPNQGRDKVKDFNTRFGLVVKSSAENGYNLTHTFPPFMKEAYRVLKPEGVLFCKIADYIHNHRHQWAHIEVIKAAIEAGFCACDCIIKVRKGPIIDPRWKEAHHARRHHCYWLIFRKSKKCE